MTHELKHIVKQFETRKEEESRAVLATVVALDGSSYRRPGVRMLLFDNGDRVGAVSGGCVEKEVWRQATSVLTSGTSKIMVYDGRYRLGCEGILYILLELFDPSAAFFSAFWDTIQERKNFKISSFFKKELSESSGYHTVVDFGGTVMAINQLEKKSTEGLSCFKQEMYPCFQLLIIGAEHDAVQLCKYAALTGWEVTVVANPKEEKSEVDFPGIKRLLNIDPELYRPEVDAQTAVLVMTHSFVKDLQFLMTLQDQNCAYLGLLGPLRRREKLFDELLERSPEISEEFLDQVHGPSGLDIGSETPQEIAISILSEILAVINRKEPSLLKYKVGRIHT
ncbi:XdhC family protein [Flagellimonas flava]|uniref:Xanthine and CO dehydrogenase maturation factor, XdhC/CoxF family n=1 Tax=Flagellimonas flava TaxID=570519 RepID=A0A1M5ISJ9_9FLAO|nr:XdhC/CoxI family protein [Allomuricauda flava]SHG31338.1 Xanthine and CO dehydrogenase maturation factor, XdhC/CoxF family [Allomuricauda flava]